MREQDREDVPKLNNTEDKTITVSNLVEKEVKIYTTKNVTK